MDKLHDTLDKLFHEADHLERAVGDKDTLSQEEVALALRAAKGVRRHSTMVVQALARIRDELQP